MKVALLLLLGAASADCLADKVIKVEPIGQGSQAIFWSAGNPMLVSDGRATRIFATANARVKKKQRMLILIGVTNYGEDLFEISEEDIQASNSKGDEIKVWTADEYREEIERRGNKARWAAALASGLQSMAASMGSRSTTTGSVYIYGSGGQAYGSFSARGRDEAALAQRQAGIQAQQQATQSAIQQKEAQELTAADYMLQRTTVFPKQTYLGYIQIHPPNKTGSTDEIHLRVKAGPDVHPIQFRYFFSKDLNSD